MYKGHIEKSSGVMIAQINWGERTFFVQEGDAMKEWRVSAVNKERVIVHGSEGEELILPLNQQVFSTKPYAIFGFFANDNEMKVKVGDTIEGYKVLDITQAAVILYKDSMTITVSK